MGGKGGASPPQPGGYGGGHPPRPRLRRGLAEGTGGGAPLYRPKVGSITWSAGPKAPPTMLYILLSVYAEGFYPVPDENFRRKFRRSLSSKKKLLPKITQYNNR